MNIWTEKSIALANQRNYLDLLYKIYPMSINLRRELAEATVQKITINFNNRDNINLLKVLLEQEIFPIKDSYVAYLKRDKTAINRNPFTVNRLSGMLYEMGLEEIFDKTTVPKETNRQIGPLFKKWIDQETLGCKVTKDKNEFLNYNGNIIFNGTDEQMKNLAKEFLGYDRNKGLDFLCKFNNTIVLAEAKFISDFGGHQNAQFEDAISTMKSNVYNQNYKVKAISILDGVLYIQGNSKMYKYITEKFSDDEVIISAVLLRDFLYTL